MGLVGSLEDLALAELLQIVGLSNKTGVLILRGAEGEGRIVFQDGLVRGAVAPGGPTNLREVLVGDDIVSKEDFESAEGEASTGDQEVAAILIQRDVITRERLESVCGDTVESAVVKLLGWKSGDFSLDVRDAREPADPKVWTETGLNPQYLMMEACRLSDESRSDTASEESAETERPDEVEAATPAPMDRTATAPTSAPAKPPVVLIESNPDALEWTKNSLKGVFPRVHGFQHPDPAVARIRQYLGNGTLPLVLVSCDDGRANPSNRISELRALVGRLKAQAARAPVLWLAAAGELAPEISPADGLVTRPTQRELSGPVAAARTEPIAEQLRTELLACLSRLATE